MSLTTHKVVRVYEFAHATGAPSTVAMELLKAAGHAVKSPSSRIDADDLLPIEREALIAALVQYRLDRGLSAVRLSGNLPMTSPTFDARLSSTTRPEDVFGPIDLDSFGPHPMGRHL